MVEIEKKRPTNLTEMTNALKAMGTDQSGERARAFQPQATDIIISPYAKSGTTWLQQMVHSLRSGGDMSFREISVVVPWLETAHDLGLDIEAAQAWTPRAYKSHMTWHDVPKGGKYICSIRNPKDAAVSFYYFFEDFFFEKGSISLVEFVEDFYLVRDAEYTYWTHLASWWAQRENPNVLLLCFEEMKANLPETVRRVAEFIGVPSDEALLEIGVKHASYAFMKAHDEQFNDVLMRELGERKAGLPKGGNLLKVRDGKTNAHKQVLPAYLSDRMDEIWAREIATRFGLESYAALHDALRYDS